MLLLHFPAVAAAASLDCVAPTRAMIDYATTNTEVLVMVYAMLMIRTDIYVSCFW